jgi:diguanylate cyclase (GGDEF)-like protein/PAS domain S-box-containing protein
MGTAKPSLAISSPSNAHAIGRIDATLHRALVESRQRYKELVELSSDLAWETDESARFSFVSPGGGLGWRPSDLVGRDVAAFLDDPSRCAIFAAHEPMSDQEIGFRRSDGNVACLMVAAKPLHDAAGGWIGARGVARDITELRRQERDFAVTRLHESLMTRIVRTMRDELDGTAALTAAIAATCLAIGATGGTVLRNSASAEKEQAGRWGDVAPEHALDMAADLLRKSVSCSLTCDDLHVIGHAARFRQEQQGTVILWKPEDDGAFEAGDLGLLADVTDYLGGALAQIASVERIVTLSRTDPLTELLNRRAFIEELDRRLARLSRDSVSGQGGADRTGTLFFIDLDNFKRLNDELGHAAGDCILCSVAQMLRGLCRSHDLIGRLGGDEFVVWIDSIERGVALKRARSFLDRFSAQIQDGDDVTRRMGMSIGVAYSNSSPGHTAKKIIARADRAMYRAKQAGKGRITVAPDEDAPAVAEKPA